MHLVSTKGERQKITALKINIFKRMMARQAKSKNENAKRSWRVDKSPTIRSNLQDSAVVGKNLCIRRLCSSTYMLN